MYLPGDDLIPVQEMVNEITGTKPLNLGTNRLGNSKRTHWWDRDVANRIIAYMHLGVPYNFARRFETSLPNQQTLWHWTQGRQRAPASFRNEWYDARGHLGDIIGHGQFEVLLTIKERATEIANSEMYECLPEDEAVKMAEKRALAECKELSKAMRWAASRMCPKDWGEKLQLSHTPELTSGITKQISAMSDEQLEKVAKLELDISKNTVDADYTDVTEVKVIGAGNGSTPTQQ